MFRYFNTHNCDITKSRRSTFNHSIIGIPPIFAYVRERPTITKIWRSLKIEVQVEITKLN